MNLPQALTRHELLHLSPDTCFIAISQRVGQRFADQRGYQQGYATFDQRFLNLRNLITAVIGDGRIRASSLVIYDPPQQEKHNVVLARFWMDCLIESVTMNQEVSFHCRLVDGSPQGNLPFTLILDDADFENHPWRPIKRLTP